MPRLTTYERLRRYIYRGRLRPGQKIVERDLARQLNISRIPLRESLARLQSDGLVRIVPYSSTYIEEFAPADILEIYSMRLALEPLATRIATELAEPALVRRLRKFCDRMTRHAALNQWAALDRVDYAFHLEIVKAARHKRLLRAYEGAHVCVIGPRTQYSVLQTLPPESTAKEHLAIVLAIERGNADTAEQVARRHIEASLETVKQQLNL